MTTKQFEVGRTYTCRSIGDSECIYRFDIIRRTAKQITFLEHKKEQTRGVFVRDGIEHCKPHGTHSMCAVIRASQE